MTPEMETALGQMMAAAVHAEGHRAKLPKDPDIDKRSAQLANRKSRLMRLARERGARGFIVKDVSQSLSVAGNTARDVINDAIAAGQIYGVDGPRNTVRYYVKDAA